MAHTRTERLGPAGYRVPSVRKAAVWGAALVAVVYLYSLLLSDGAVSTFALGMSFAIIALCAVCSSPSWGACTSPRRAGTGSGVHARPRWVTRVLRLWLLRQLVEQQAQADRIAAALESR